MDVRRGEQAVGDEPERRTTRTAPSAEDSPAGQREPAQDARAARRQHEQDRRCRASAARPHAPVPVEEVVEDRRLVLGPGELLATIGADDDVLDPARIDAPDHDLAADRLGLRRSRRDGSGPLPSAARPRLELPSPRAPCRAGRTFAYVSSSDRGTSTRNVPSRAMRVSASPRRIGRPPASTGIPAAMAPDERRARAPGADPGDRRGRGAGCRRRPRPGSTKPMQRRPRGGAPRAGGRACARTQVVTSMGRPAPAAARTPACASLRPLGSWDRRRPASADGHRDVQAAVGLAPRVARTSTPRGPSRSSPRSPAVASISSAPVPRSKWNTSTATAAAPHSAIHSNASAFTSRGHGQG